MARPAVLARLDHAAQHVPQVLRVISVRARPRGELPLGAAWNSLLLEQQRDLGERPRAASGIVAVG